MSAKSAVLGVIAGVHRSTGDFPAAWLLAEILKEEESHFGEKDLLFTAFMTWVCFPDNHLAIRTALMLRLFRKLDHLENVARERFPDLSPVDAYIRVRQRPKYAPLFDEMYEALGGMSGAIHIQSSLRHSLNRHERVRRARHVYVLISMMHFQLNALEKVSGQPSLNKAIAAYQALFGKSSEKEKGEERREEKGQKGNRSLDNYWLEFEASLPFIYAGLATSDGSIPVSFEGDRKKEPTSLLERLTLNMPTYGSRKTDFARFARRALFTQNAVLSKSPAYPQKFEFPSDLNEEKIAAPTVPEDRRNRVRKAFGDGRISATPRLVPEPGM